MVLLTTTGAKSGEKRVNPLVGAGRRRHPLRVASKAGAPTSPDWYHNLVANPRGRGGVRRRPLRRPPPCRSPRGRSGTASTPPRWRCSPASPTTRRRPRGSSRSWSSAAGPDPGADRSPPPRGRVTGGRNARDSRGGPGQGRLLPLRSRPRIARCPGRAVGPGQLPPGSGSRDRSILTASGVCSGAGIPSREWCSDTGRNIGRGLRSHLQRAQVGQCAVRAGRVRTRPNAVVAAHAHAVEGSLSYLEQHGITATRRIRSRPGSVLPDHGAVAAVFTHGVSRNGDPHLHSHVVLANLVHGSRRPLGCLRPAGDRRPPQWRPRRSTRRTCAPAWLSALGVRWSRSARAQSSEVVGVGPELLGRVLEPGCGHPPPHGRSWGTLEPWRPHRLGGHPSRQGAWRRRSATSWSAGSAGPPPSASRLELEARRAWTSGHRAVLDEHRFAGVHRPPAHGGAHRRDVVAAFGAAARDGVSAPAVDATGGPMGAGGAAGGGRTAPARRTVVPAQPSPARSWVRGRSTPTITRSGWAPPAAIDAYRDRWGLAQTAEPLGDRAAQAWPPCRPTVWPITSAPSGRSPVARARLGWREPFTVERGLRTLSQRPRSADRAGRARARAAAARARGSMHAPA